MMESSKGSSNMKTMMYSGKHALLPPKSPFPSIAPSYADYIQNPAIGSKAIQKPRERNTHHRTSSESFLIEEQPSWLDDLLNEPETPVHRRGHRRSSSDSFAYVDAVNAANIDYATQDEFKYKSMIPVPSWGSRDFDNYKDAWHASLLAEMNLPKHKNNIGYQNSGLSYATEEANGVHTTRNNKQDAVDSVPHDPKISSEWRDASLAKPLPSETDTKRAKQQFAQRSRVRKLQYIAELESNVQALQAEGSKVSAELEFMNQQSVILSMENKALKQRLESLAQEKLIKYLEQEVLEREIGRLRAVYQLKQPPQAQSQQQPSSIHRRSGSRDLDSQFANLSTKHKDPSSGLDSVFGQLHI